MDAHFHIIEDKNITPAEFAELMGSVGWGAATDYDPAAIERSLAAYPFVAHVRDGSGRLVGYISAFSDGAFSTFIGELVVRPEAQGRGIGTALLELVEQRYTGIPLFVHTFVDVQEFFLQRGYRAPAHPMRALSKRNGMTLPA